jgi:GT2 family glycosyltransferase
MASLKIIVPFYKNSQLVAPLFESLKSFYKESNNIEAEVVFYNDSPDDLALASELNKCLKEIPFFKLKIITNPENLGFVKTVNQGFKLAASDRCDVIILNSDTYLFPGAIQEMMAVANLDPMIGFVCPRSNNATLATYPHSANNQDLSPIEAQAMYSRTGKFLPRFTWVPTVVGFCMLIRWNILSEFGVFDEIYGQGYNEENDLVCRAGRYGYRAVLANHAFVWHQGEASFGITSSSKKERDERNGRILAERYPEYLVRVHSFYNSPEYRAESLLEELGSINTKIKIGFDFSSFGPYHNGTFEAGIKILKAAVENWPRKYSIYVYISESAFDFHCLGKIPRIVRVDFNDNNAKMAAIVRMGQPFSIMSLLNLYNSAPVVGIFMLDAIAFDCSNLSIEFDRRVWDYVYEYSDAIFYISSFTADRLEARFIPGAEVISRITRLSLDISEYEPSFNIQKYKVSEDYLFIIGNNFSHKFVSETVIAIMSNYPDMKIKIIGGDKFPSENVEVIESGLITNEQLSHLYYGAKAVIFPSLYEGFGFPILHSLAHKKVVFARDSDLNRELIQEIGDSKNIKLYIDTNHLIELICTEEMIYENVSNLRDREGWKRGANDVLGALELKLTTVKYSSLVDRLRWLNYIVAPNNSALTSGQKVSMKVGKFIDDALHKKIVRYPLLWVYRNLIKKFR